LDGLAPERIVLGLLSCSSDRYEHRSDRAFLKQGTKRLLECGHLYIEDDTLRMVIQAWDRKKRRVSASIEHPSDTHGAPIEHPWSTHRASMAHPSPSQPLDITRGALPIEEQTRADHSRVEERASKESEEASKQPDDPSIALPAAYPLSKLLEDYRSRWATRYPKKRPLDVERHEHELADALSKAEQEEGDTEQVLHHALDAFFADDGQAKFGPGHMPKGLVYHWDRYIEPYLEQFKRQVRERRDARYQRALEEAGQKRLAKALGNGAETDPEKAQVIIAELMAGIGRTV
jgi:chemotaxis protein histidine kinase CheA